MFIHEDLIYHRGRHGDVQLPSGRIVRVEENSIAAFECAVLSGAAMVEFDARSGKVGHAPVVAHDAEHGECSPTVESVLQTIKGQSAVNIEIKDPSVCGTVLDLIRKAIAGGVWSQEQFVLTSFHHPSVFLAKAEYPELTVGAIMDAVPDLSYLNLLARKRVDNVHMEYMNANMDMQNERVFIRRAKKLGMHVWVWTVNDVSIAKRVYQWGAERIFTDRPELFA